MAEPMTIDIEYCPESKRVDGKKHSWKWDGDAPRIICHYCDEMRDSISGSVITPGRHRRTITAPMPAIAAADAGKPSKEEFGKALEDMLNKHRWLITTQSRDPYRQQYSDDFDAARREVERMAGYGEEG